MAKKSARKAQGKGGKKQTKKAPTRAAAKPVKKGAPRKTKAGMALGPKPVKTGKGATPAEIGQDLVALVNSGRHAEVEKKWWSPAVESIEGGPTSMVWSGRKAVEGKNTWWLSMNTPLGMTAEGPYVGGTGFSVKFVVKSEENATGKQVEMTEVGVYTVKNGKIVREEFMYGPMTVLRESRPVPQLAPTNGSSEQTTGAPVGAAS